MDYYGNNDWRDYLAHYGVKGMKWRKHKYKDKIGDIYEYASGKLGEGKMAVKNFVDYKVTGKGYLRDAKKNRLKADKYSSYSYGSAQAARGRMHNSLASKQLEKYNEISRRNSKLPGVKYKPVHSISTGAVARRTVGGRYNTYENNLGNSKGIGRVARNAVDKARARTYSGGTMSKVHKRADAWRKLKTNRDSRKHAASRSGKLKRLWSK